MTDFSAVRVAGVDGAPELAWANGSEFSVPTAVAVRLPRASDGAVRLTASSIVEESGAAEATRLRAAFTAAPPTSSRLPFSYQIVPLPIRTAIGHALGRVQRRRADRWAAFPRWPLDLSADFVSDLCGGPPAPFAGRPTPVLLSHDIDTAEGLRNLVDRFLAVEESIGARSSNYVVPCAWPIDHGLLASVNARGHEVGIHGYDHGNRTPFADAEERRRRIAGAGPLAERYGAIGYRAPSLLRTRGLLDDLAGAYRYDSSIPTSGGMFPVPNNGCASARPFYIGSLVEIPLTLPRDGSLMFLGLAPDEIFAMWCECAERIAASGGVVSLLTHCEDRFSGGRQMFALYERFLAYLAGDTRYAFALPAQLLDRVSSSNRSMT